MRPKWLSCSHFTLSTWRQNCMVFKSPGLDANRLHCVAQIGYLTLYASVSRPFEDKMKWFMQVFGARSNPWVVATTRTFLWIGFSTWALVTLWPGWFFDVGAVLCIAECSPASLVSTHWMPAAALPVPSPPNPPLWQSKMSPDVAKCVPGDGGTESSLIGNHCFGWIQVLDDEGNSILCLDMHSVFKPQLWKNQSLI